MLIERAKSHASDAHYYSIGDVYGKTTVKNAKLNILGYRMKQFKILKIIGVFLACLILFNISGCSPQVVTPTPKFSSKPAETSTTPEKEVMPIKIGDVAPQFTLVDIEGKTVSLNHYLGQKVILNMWWLQCHGCTDEMPYLQEFYQKRVGEMALLAINTYDSGKMIKAYAEAKLLTFTLLVDPERKLDRAYIIAGVPTTFFLDQHGVIKAIKDGSFESVADVEELYNSY